MTRDGVSPEVCPLSSSRGVEVLLCRKPVSATAELVSRHAATASVGVQHGMLLMRWCYTACRRTTAGAYMPDMRRAVVIALDTCKGMAYLHRHGCATLCRRL